MDHDNYLLACLYCGDTMEKPNQEVLDKFGEDMFKCCEHRMAEVDMNEMYKVVKALDILRDNIEEEMIRGL